MRFIAELAGPFLGFALAFAGPVRAQDLSLLGQDMSLFGQMPTTFEQCARESQERELLIRAIREESSQCLRASSGIRQAFISECDYAWPRDCASLERQWCVLSNRNTEQGQLCRDRAREAQQQQAERERLEAERLRAEATAAREQDQALRMIAAAAGRRDLGLALSIARNGIVDPNDPTRAPRLLASGGRQLANAVGVPTTPAMRLSGALSRIALGEYRDLGARVLAEFDGASGSGAFQVGGESTGSSGTTMSASRVNNSDTTAALQSEAQAYAELWNNGGDIGRVIAAQAIAARIAEIMQDRPANNADMARVSLVSGAFARSINALTDAATLGEISLTDGSSPYTMASRVMVLYAQPEVARPPLTGRPPAQPPADAQPLQNAPVDQIEQPIAPSPEILSSENYQGDNPNDYLLDSEPGSAATLSRAVGGFRDWQTRPRIVDLHDPPPMCLTISEVNGEFEYQNSCGYALLCAIRTDQPGEFDGLHYIFLQSDTSAWMLSWSEWPQELNLPRLYLWPYGIVTFLRNQESIRCSQPLTDDPIAPTFDLNGAPYDGISCFGDSPGQLICNGPEERFFREQERNARLQ